ncbi:hypothetical protein HHS34_010520 [Acidithiobacillus montserratensis]|uniref:Uncharacterized protein n=1 Tax=Acidithiobacillus montserratensis TaxID=2729135 RepID=A0ACD5HDB1_9PROT|nr:hypothetical protein [Acidithiobacillus montserratensis]
MTETVENLVLEHLRAIRNDLTAFRSETRSELSDIKHRLGRVEEQIVGLRRDVVRCPRRHLSVTNAY